MAQGRYHWSKSAPPARFIVINAIASVPWLLVLLFPRPTTAILAVIATAFFIYVEKYKKMTVEAYLRSIGLFLTGRVKATTNLLKELAK